MDEVLIKHEGDTIRVNINTMLFRPALNNEGKWYPSSYETNAVISDFSYYSGYLFPLTGYSDENECWKICWAMTKAYKAGSAAKLREVKKVLEI